MPLPTQKKIRQRLRQQRGWTLIELLVGMVMMLVVILAAFPIIEGAAKTEGRIQTAAVGIGQARVFSDQVLRDLRPTTGVLARSNTGLTVNTYVRHSCGSSTPSAENAPATECRVAYLCSGDTCSRRESLLDGTGAGPWVTMVTGLENAGVDVFSYVVPGDVPTFVGIKLVIPNQDGGDAITMQDGTALRNSGT